MKKAIMLLAATLLASTAATSAQAALVDYGINAALTDGREVTGFFTLDTNAVSIRQYSNVSFVVTGLSPFSKITALTYSGQAAVSTSAFGLTFSNGTDYRLNVFFTGAHSDFTLLDVVGNQIHTISSMLYNVSGQQTRFAGGTISQVSGAVPEPATWALMILGMGFVGFAMRCRKNVDMTVRFA